MTSIISEHGFRQDGREPCQIRNISVNFGVYPQADGSAYFEQGNTKVLCAVYGPHEPRQRGRLLEDRCYINCQLSVATFATADRKEKRHGDRRIIEFARLIEKAFESVILVDFYRRSEIGLFCEILQDDGSVLAACVNAACMALLDSGICMRGLVASATCASTSFGQLVMDANLREESDAISRLTIAIMSSADKIVLTEFQNQLHYDLLVQLIESSKDAATSVHSCLEAAVLKHIAASKCDKDRETEMMES